MTNNNNKEIFLSNSLGMYVSAVKDSPEHLKLLANGFKRALVLTK